MNKHEDNDKVIEVPFVDDVNLSYINQIYYHRK